MENFAEKEIVVIFVNKQKRQMIDITELRKLNTLERIVVTEHARTKLHSRGISIYDVQKTIQEGEIIRQYEYNYEMSTLRLQCSQK